MNRSQLWREELPNGSKIAGQMVELKKENLVEFAPSLWHEVQPWEGDRLVMLMYTPRATKLQNEHYEDLQKLGFVIEKEEGNQDDFDEEEDIAEVRRLDLQGQEYPI